MQITVDKIGQATVIAVEGSIDALTAGDFQESMQAELANGNVQLVADMSGVDYASSAGLRAILMGLKSSRRLGGDLRLAALQKGVYRVVKMTGFDSILQIYDDVQGAVSSYGEEA